MADDDEEEEEEITADTLRCKSRALPISAQSAFSYVPPRRQDPKEHSYYYRQGKRLPCQSRAQKPTCKPKTRRQS